jgi:hypothetical protein
MTEQIEILGKPIEYDAALKLQPDEPDRAVAIHCQTSITVPNDSGCAMSVGPLTNPADERGQNQDAGLTLSGEEWEQIEEAWDERDKQRAAERDVAAKDTKKMPH